MVLITALICVLVQSQFLAAFARPQDPSPAVAATEPAPAPAPAQGSGPSSTPIPIISQTEVFGADGSFNFSYETGNGIHIQEGGYLKHAPAVASRSGELREGESTEEDIQVLQGSYSYTAPNGQVISLRYIADENGFQPEGDHIPTLGQGFPKASLDESSPEQEASQSESQPVKQEPDQPAPKPEAYKEAVPQTTQAELQSATVTEAATAITESSTVA